MNPNYPEVTQKSTLKTDKRHNIPQPPKSQENLPIGWSGGIIRPMKYPQFIIEMPGWVHSFLDDFKNGCSSLEERMRLIIDLSRTNIEQKSGGPFAAGVFEIETGLLISGGVNMVETGKSSILHAEIVAIAMAQRILGTYDLANISGKSYELVTSTEPCSMCLGAIGWSGIKQVVCGARGCDAEAIGFDEGAKPAKGILSLEDKGITVVRDVLRDKASAVLNQYKETNGKIYNPEQK